jgi:subtilisin family serine protease
MKPRSLLLVALAAALGACASLHPAAAPGNASDVARASTANVASMDSERDIVLAVANPLEPTAANAGSSLLGYSPSRYYGAGQRATSTLAALKQSYRLRDITGWPIKALGVYCVVFEPPAGTSRESLLKALAADARVQLAQPLHDYAVYAAASPGIHHYSDPYVDLQRGFAETDAAAAQLVSQGRGVHIAIVDTGVDLEHVDLRGRIRDAHNLVDDDASAFSRDSHGTEVAGVVAATADNHQGIVGMAPRATLSVYKACWYALAAAGARCNTFTLAKALAGIVDTDARVINLSLGGPADPLLHLLLAKLLDQGRIVIAAMPVEGITAEFPGSAVGVIVVRASAASAAPPGVLSAPGNDILTTQPGGGYDFTSGSSMAAAHVSGIAALLLSLSPALDARTLHDLLLQTSKASAGTLQVNAAAAVARLRDTRKVVR